MVVDYGLQSYICTTYGGDGKWPWCWIRSETMLDAVRDFTEWLDLNDDDLSRYA